MTKNLNCEIVSLDEVYRLSQELARDILQSEYKPDLVIAIARGGFVPARLLCDFLHLHQLTSIKIEHYKAGAQKERIATIKYPLNIDIHGKKVLLVDDVNDTGESLQTGLHHLGEFQPSEIKTAVLHEKMGSMVTADFCGQYIKEWHWILYQWAANEDISHFIEKMDTDDPELILDRLQWQYGISISMENLKDILFFSPNKAPSLSPL